MNIERAQCGYNINFIEALPRREFRVELQFPSNLSIKLQSAPAGRGGRRRRRIVDTCVHLESRYGVVDGGELARARLNDLNNRPGSSSSSSSETIEIRSRFEAKKEIAQYRGLRKCFFFFLDFFPPRQLRTQTSDIDRSRSKSIID